MARGHRETNDINGVLAQNSVCDFILKQIKVKHMTRPLWEILI